MAYPTVCEHHKRYPDTSILASPYSCDPTGTIDIAAGIETLKSAQSNTGTVVVPKGTYKVGTDLTLPVGMLFRFESGASFVVATGKTLTVNCSLEYPEAAVPFTVAGTGIVTFGTSFPITAYTLRLPSGAWSVTANTTIPSNVTLKLDRGAIITVATTKTLTINGTLEAGLYQIFSLAGTGKATFTTGTQVKSSWFASLTDAVTCMGTTSVEFEITKTETVSDDTTLVATTKVVNPSGLILTISNTKTLTINGTLDAGLYQIFDCQGTGKVVFGSGSAVQVAWWGSDGPAVQAAITSMVAVTGQVLLKPNTSYAFTVTLTTYKGIELVGSNSILNFAALTTPDTAVSVDPNGTVSLQGMNPVARDVHFKGNATMAAGTYTADLTGFEFNTSNIAFHHCLFTGFDKATDFDTNSFSVEFNQCTSRYNNYGFYYDATGQTNTGERITWNGGGITNNNYGIYNKLGELFFRNVSIDYNLEAHVSDNITDTGGVASVLLSFVDCHFENTEATSAEGKVRITNSGRMVIRGGNFQDEADSLFVNSGHLSIDRMLWRVQETKYTITNTGYLNVTDLFTLDATRNPRLCAVASKVKNNGFEAGNLTGWTIAPGTEAAADNTTAYEGTWSMKIAPTGAGTATWVTSQKIVAPPGRQYANLTFWAKSAAVPTLSVFLMVYEIEGVIAAYTPLQTTYTEVTVPPATAAWTRYRAQAALPPNGGYVLIQLQMPANADTTHFANVDEFVVDWQ